MITLCSHSKLPENTAPSPTIGDIFRKYGPAFRAANRLHPRQHKIMYDIEHCRRGEFGTHWEICDTCGHLEKGYNSCRNRHCPGCNDIARRRWVSTRIEELLPVSYHHCVFTLPDIFNPLCRYNRQAIYDLLFESAAKTLLEFGQNPKRLGAKIGFYGILHTWGGKLPLHPHIHFIVTAGGINALGEWVEPKYSASFLFPVTALSNVFRAKFLSSLIAAQNSGQLKLPDEMVQYSRPCAFRQWLYHTTPKEWVVYSKPPFSSPAEVVKYIGRYTHSTAISNNRIISVDDDIVKFWFKNTRKKSRWEITSLPVMEFIDRFLLHVLPKNFHRIRYYGFLANGQASQHLPEIRRALNDRDVPDVEPLKEKVPQCPVCGKGNMITILVLDGYGNVVKEDFPKIRVGQVPAKAGSP
ncbi:MAG TPA: IS91 family transposase [Desulfobacter sp.]|nr:IS91 family transposase [Desulfobacter sp.]